MLQTPKSVIYMPALIMRETVTRRSVAITLDPINPEAVYKIKETAVREH